MKDNTHVEVLPCKLTRDEIHDKGSELARNLAKQAVLERDLDLEKQRVKKELKDLESRAADLTEQVSSGIEKRDVRCRAHLNYAERKATIIRLDTGEEIYERALTDEEMAQPLPLEEKRRRRAADAASGDVELS